MLSPAPASTLAEPPPAASPQLGRWICQQRLRSARIRGLLLLFAAACCCCFDDDCPCLFAFGHISYWYRAGMMKPLPGIQCVRMRRTWVLILPVFVVFFVAPCNAARACGLACFRYNSGLGWMTMYLSNTYGFIRHGGSRSNTFWGN